MSSYGYGDSLLQPEQTRTRTLSRGQRRLRRARRLSPAVIFLAVIMIAGTFALFQLSPPASATTLTVANDAVGSTLARTSMTQLSGALQPQQNTSQLQSGQQSIKNHTQSRDPQTNAYDWTGYKGNYSIYPTQYQYAIDLPPESSLNYQTESNASIPVANNLILNISTASNEVPHYWNLGPSGNYAVMVWVWVVATSGSQQYSLWPEGCDASGNSYQTDAQNFVVTPSGLPSVNENTIEVFNDTSQNLTNTSGGGKGYAPFDLNSLVGLGLTAASLLFPEEDAIQVASVSYDLSNFVHPFGPGNDNHHSSLTNTGGDGSVNQWGMVEKGTWDECGVPSNYGQNVFSQADLSQQELFGDLAGVSSGLLKFSASNELEFTGNGCNPCFDQGASASVSYAVEPAISVNGTIDLWNGGPAVSDANSQIQQQFGSCDCDFQTNYETTNSKGYFHDFLNPDVWFTQAVARFSDPLGSVQVGSDYCPSSCGSYTDQIPIGQSWPGTNWSEGSAQTLNMAVNGGEATGIVTANGQPLNGATVKLCNNEGCISTTSSKQGAQNGWYSLQYPVPGTSADPFVFTVSAPGWGMNTVTNYNVPIGQYTTENLQLSSLYTVTFTEQGLPGGSTWSVSFAGLGLEKASAPAAIVYTIGSGTWSFTAYASDYVCTRGWATWYSPSPSYGSIGVSGNARQLISYSPASGACGGCVAWGTPILTPSGYVAVQKLEPGDSIIEYNLTTHATTTGTFLSANTTRVTQIIDVNDGWLRLTPTDQPLYIRNASFVGWLHNPQDLTTADSIFDPATGSWVQVTSLSLIHTHTVVYDVKDKGEHDYIANGALLLDKVA